MAQTSTEWLEQAYPHMRPASKAPTFDDLRAWCDQRGVSLERTMSAEAEKWYSAARKVGDSFEAFRVRNNAALMAWALERGENYRFAKPEQMTDVATAPIRKKKNLFGTAA